MPLSTLTTSSFSFSSSIAGRMRSRCRPFGYRSSGWKFEVVTMPTPVLEQRLEQPVQDHRVGDVGDVELVEADQPVAPRDALRRARRAGSTVPFSSAQLAVHLAHELVEVQPRLALQRHRVEEAVHQEALAAPDAAVHVDAARDRRARDQLGAARCCAAPCSRPTRSRSARARRRRAAAPGRRCSRARRASARRARGPHGARRWRRAAQKFSVRLSTASAASLVASRQRRMRVADARDVLGRRP